MAVIEAQALAKRFGGVAAVQGISFAVEGGERRHLAMRIGTLFGQRSQLIYDDRVSRMRRELLRTRLIDVRFETAPDSIEIEGARLVKLSGPGAKLEVDTDVRSIRAVLGDLLDRYEVADISVTERPLEDVITHIYGQAPV